MKIKGSFSIFLVFIICGVLGLYPQSALYPAEGPAELIHIGVEDVEGTTEIEIKSSAPFTYTLYKPDDPYQIMIDLQNVDIGSFNETISVDRDGVFEIVPSKDETMPGVTKIRISLTVPADVEPVYRDNSLILAFDNPESEEPVSEAVATTTEEAEVKTLMKEEVQYEEEEEEYEEEPYAAPEYVGEKISIDFQDAELLHVFRLIADVSGYNIVVSPDVKGKFSMKLIDVPWDQALDVILRNYSLSKSVEGNIIRVAPTSVLAKEEEEIAKAKDSKEKSGDLVTKIYPVNYADVEEIKKAIDNAKILTKRGFISIDTRTTSIIIKDVDKKHKEYETLIKALDVATPQVSIDARFVEATTNFTKELGVRWAVDYRPESQIQIGGTGAVNEVSPLTLDAFAMNSPAAVTKGAGAELALGYLGAGVLRSLDLHLSALELSGNGKIISNPRVITMDNQEARINQGKKIPYETVSDEGTKTEFVDAALQLIVTPHITPHGTILMNIEAKKNEANFSETSAGGVPTIDTNEIETQVLIKDGDTIVLGGIFKTTSSKDVSGIPVISKLPGVGWLFRKKEKNEDTTEIIIFITPRIIKKI